MEWKFFFYWKFYHYFILYKKLKNSLKIEIVLKYFNFEKQNRADSFNIRYLLFKKILYWKWKDLMKVRFNDVINISRARLQFLITYYLLSHIHCTLYNKNKIFFIITAWISLMPLHLFIFKEIIETKFCIIFIVSPI